MATKKKKMAATPAIQAEKKARTFKTYPCTVEGCDRTYESGRSGGGGKCSRCRKAEYDGREPGEPLKRRQPPGQAKERIGGRMLPALMRALESPETQEAHGVESPWQLVELAVAEKFGTAGDLKLLRESWGL